METEVRGISLDSTAKQKVNFDVIRALLYFIPNVISLDMSTWIFRSKSKEMQREKNIETKRMKKEYCIVYHKRVIAEDITKHYLMPFGY